MRYSISVIVATCSVSVGQGAISSAPADYATDDVITLMYGPSIGIFELDNPAGDDAAAAITTFDLTSSEDFFTGPAPFGFDGPDDVWSPTRALRVDPDGFFDMEWPAGSVEVGVGNVNDILTLNGSFLSGGSLEPFDLCICFPEPTSLTLLYLGAFALFTTGRRSR